MLGEMATKWAVQQAAGLFGFGSGVGTGSSPISLASSGASLVKGAKAVGGWMGMGSGAGTTAGSAMSMAGPAGGFAGTSAASGSMSGMNMAALMNPATGIIAGIAMLAITDILEGSTDANVYFRGAGKQRSLIGGFGEGGAGQYQDWTGQKTSSKYGYNLGFGVDSGVSIGDQESLYSGIDTLLDRLGSKEEVTAAIDQMNITSGSIDTLVKSLSTKTAMNINLTVNALDGANVEDVTKTKIIPALKDAMNDNYAGYADEIVKANERA